MADGIGSIEMDTEEAVDRLLGSLRKRLLQARANGQTVRCHAKETIKQNSLFQPDGGFRFTLEIEPPKDGGKLLPHAAGRLTP